MSGILSVKDRIAMMNTSKANKTAPPEPTASVDNPVRKTGSIADKIAALKASSEKPEQQHEKVFTTQSPIAAAASTSSVSKQASNSSPETTDGAPAASSSTQAEQSQPSAPAERRLSIKDRIAAMKGGAVPIIAPAPGPTAVSRPSIVGASRPLSVASPSQPSVDNSVKEPEPVVEKSTETAVKSDETKEEPKDQSVPVEKATEGDATTVEAKQDATSEPAKPSELAPTVEAPVAEPTAPAEGQAAEKNQEKEVEVSSEQSSGSKANSIAAKIAALKQQQQPPPKPTEGAAPSETKDRRRLSTDLKNFGAKIALPMPGAPRPIFRPPPPSDEKEHSEPTGSGASRGSAAVDENGELKHLSLSRPSVNSVSRKRAVKSVKLSASWQDELTSEDITAALRPIASTSTAATTTEDATTTTTSTI